MTLNHLTYSRSTSSFKSTPLYLLPKCSKCNSTSTKDMKTELSKCSRCLLVKYCSRECQVDHFEKHKAFCNSIKKKRKGMLHLEAPLRHYWNGEWEEDMFETSAGHFWGLHFPRSYLNSR